MSGKGLIVIDSELPRCHHLVEAQAGAVPLPVAEPAGVHGLTDWTVVIPVKGTPDAKSRLGASAEMAMAIALDTVETLRHYA